MPNQDFMPHGYVDPDEVFVPPPPVKPPLSSQMFFPPAEFGMGNGVESPKEMYCQSMECIERLRRLKEEGIEPPLPITSCPPGQKMFVSETRPPQYHCVPDECPDYLQSPSVDCEEGYRPTFTIGPDGCRVFDRCEPIYRPQVRELPLQERRKELLVKFALKNGWIKGGQCTREMQPPGRSQLRSCGFVNVQRSRREPVRRMNFDQTVVYVWQRGHYGPQYR